ncbi:MAG: hypothetical protein J5966_05080 [Lachnospiraceae bacterium]|nr:hypothetical protein [Lachnospiraceae bacterium]
MQVKCDFCGSYIDEQLETCPNCGAPNEHIKRAATGVPRTIAELKEFCEKNNVPLDKFHFHIGEDYKGPQAFGIYYDEQKKEYVVYKNKSDGSRAVRYHGHDEGYAVNEIYQKLKEQIGDYKAYRASKGAIHTGSSNKKPAEDPGSKRIQMITWAIIIIVVLIVIIKSMSGNSSSHGSFYNYNGHSYYYDDGSWYSYNSNTGDYTETSEVPSELENHRDDYYDDVNEYNKQTVDSDWDDDSDFDWSWDSSDDSGWDSGWDSGGSWDSDW